MRGQDSTFLNGKRYQFCCHLGHERMGILFFFFIYGDEGYSLCVWTNLVQLRIWFLGRMVLENGSGDGGGFYFSGRWNRWLNCKSLSCVPDSKEMDWTGGYGYIGKSLSCI